MTLDITIFNLNDIKLSLKYTFCLLNDNKSSEFNENMVL